MPRSQTLDRKVKALINEHGPLAAGFMAQAMSTYCEKIRGMSEAELQEKIGTMFDAKTWQALATAVQTKLAE